VLATSYGMRLIRSAVSASNVVRARYEGQGLAEYALILTFIAVVAIAAVAFLGGQINSILSDVGNSI
jgi:Flp pilus assembly pilin Flp